MGFQAQGRHFSHFRASIDAGGGGLPGSPRSSALLKHVINSKCVNFIFAILRDVFAAPKLGKRWRAGVMHVALQRGGQAPSLGESRPARGGRGWVPAGTLSGSPQKSQEEGKKIKANPTGFVRIYIHFFP